MRVGSPSRRTATPAGTRSPVLLKTTLQVSGTSAEANATGLANPAHQRRPAEYNNSITALARGNEGRNQEILVPEGAWAISADWVTGGFGDLVISRFGDFRRS